MFRSVALSTGLVLLVAAAPARAQGVVQVEAATAVQKANAAAYSGLFYLRSDRQSASKTTALTNGDNVFEVEVRAESGGMAAFAGGGGVVGIEHDPSPDVPLRVSIGCGTGGAVESPPPPRTLASAGSSLILQFEVTVHADVELTFSSLDTGGGAAVQDGSTPDASGESGLVVQVDRKGPFGLTSSRFRSTSFADRDTPVFEVGATQSVTLRPGRYSITLALEGDTALTSRFDTAGVGGAFELEFRVP